MASNGVRPRHGRNRGRRAYIGGVPFAVLGAVVGVLTSFEWSRIVRDSAIDAGLVVQVFAVVIAAALAWLGLAALAIAAVIAGSISRGCCASSGGRFYRQRVYFMPGCRSWP